MAREVRDSEGAAWNSVQAYAGLSTDAARADAARISENEDCCYVVSTPAGGAQSVRLQLPGAGETGPPDQALLQKRMRAHAS